MAQPGANALKLDWVFGMNPTLPVFSLRDGDQLVILYGGVHVGVIYNHTRNSQILLQGHCNKVSCLSVSEDRHWLATADKGQNSLVIIWDAFTGVPAHTIFESHPEVGVAAMGFSNNGELLVTLGAGQPQSVCIWEWTVQTERPLHYIELSPKFGFQNYIVFNPNDSNLLLSSSEMSVLIFNIADERLELLPAKLNKPVDKPVGSYTMTVFQWRKSQTLTATTTGKIVVWDLFRKKGGKLVPTLTNVINLQKLCITVITVTENFVVTGDVRGFIHFYDDDMKLLCSYNKFELDAISFIHFSRNSTSNDEEGYPETRTLEARPIVIENFVVSTTTSTIIHVKTKGGIPEVLLREHCNPVHAVACHPAKPNMAMGSHSNILKVWNYDTKVVLCRRYFEAHQEIQCLAFDPMGQYLAVGLVNGGVFILNPDTLENDPEEYFMVTEDTIQHIIFSQDSKYLATADAGKAVTLYRLDTIEDVTQWRYLARHYSHYKPIKDLIFGVRLDSTLPRLLSLGMDRRLVEYDLENSEEYHLPLLCIDRVEQSAVPVCMSWYPPLTTEQFLMVANDQYKMKLYNSTTKMCRKTVLGPTFGSPVERVIVLPKSTDSKSPSYYQAYITREKVGLQILPLDGNPFKSVAQICHPMGASSIACSFDGKFVFTAGGSDYTVLSWKTNVDALEAAAALGGKDMEPFYTLLEGGKDGYFYREMEEFFVFCQVRFQAIDYMKKRNLTNRIPLSEMPFLMRALGVFLTEREIEDMENEVKFGRYAETGNYVTEVNLEEFIKLYINHRPAFNIFADELLQAFDTLAVDSGSGQMALQRDEMLEQLQVQGEHMTEDEVVDSFSMLAGLSEQDLDKPDVADSEYSLESLIPTEIPMETFTGHILGLPSCAVQTYRPSSAE